MLEPLDDDSVTRVNRFYRYMEKSFMKVVDDVISEEFVRFALQAKGNLNIENSNINSIGYIVANRKDPDKKYGVVIRYRNIPGSETRSQTFDDLESIKQNCAKNQLIPTIGFVLYDKEEKYGYVFIFTVEQLEHLASSGKIEDEISYVKCGIQIKYGINHKTVKEMLDKLKSNLDYIEITMGEKDFTE